MTGAITKTEKAFEAFELLETMYKAHIEETLNAELPDDEETLCLVVECRETINEALTELKELKASVPDGLAESLTVTDSCIQEATGEELHKWSKARIEAATLLKEAIE